MPEEKLPVAKLNARVINKHGTEDDWDKATNFIPKKGEIIVYEADEDDSKSVPYLKVGDGTHTVPNLPYVSNKNTDEAIEELKGNDLFKAEGLTILEPLGGISVGDKLDKMPINDVLKKLLYPYVAPEINSFTLTPAPGVYEKHVSFTVNSATIDVTKKSKDIISIRLDDGETSYDQEVLEDVLDDGKVTPSSTYSNPDGSIIWTVTVSDGVSTVKDTKTYTFVYPYYYGVISNGDTINSSTILNFEKSIRAQGSHSHEYKTTNQCPVIAYPKSYGELKSIKDPNNFTQDWAQSIVSVNNNTTIQEVEYYVYVGGASTATVTYKFNY